MRCSACGSALPYDSRFCPSCGAPVPVSPGNRTGRPPLLRPRHGRMVAGVCAAFAQAYGWNVTLIRILLVVLTPFHLGLGFLAYLIAWIVIPEQPSSLPQPPAHP